MPMVSIIIPTYNRCELVLQAIQSVQNQTFKDFEVLVIDDNSTDDTQKCITIIKDGRIHYLRNPRKGISSARNFGIENSKGKYISFLDSDDLWLPDKIEKQLEILSQDENLIVWSDASIIDAEGKEKGILLTERYGAKKRKKSGDIFLELLQGNFVSVQSIMLRRDITKKIKFDTSLIYADDYKFVIDLAQNFRYYFIPAPLVKYRIHDNNVISKNPQLWIKDLIKIYTKVTREQNKIIPRKLKAKLFYRLSKHFLIRNRRKFSRYYLWQAFRQNPFKASYLRKLLQSFLVSTPIISVRVEQVKKTEDAFMVKEQTTVMPCVSVVMTSYDHEVYLSESIESVLNQTFGDFELIIIDDSSRDRSKKIIENYANQDPRVKAVYHSENRGIAKTLNEALEIAEGQYIAIAASDDLWLCDKLEKQMKFLNQNNNLVVWSDAYIINAEGKDTGLLWSRRYKIDNKKKNGNIFYELLWGNFICPQSLILKRTIAQEIGFDARLNFAVDYKFLITISQKYNFHFISEPLVKYRMHGQNAIFHGSGLWEKDMLKIFSKIIQQNSNTLPRKLKARLHSRIGKYLLVRKKYKLSRHHFLIASKCEPFNMSYLRRFLRTFSIFHSDKNELGK
ncbi:MAG: glycosyltransferase [Sedimentisphaerales bacterium]|nr:glycosyltransferase [Sedimentisphaerales bacterium]